MEINVDYLEQIYNELSKSISSFEDNYLNVYNTLKDVENNWYDYHARLFFNNSAIEKNEINRSIIELYELSDTYKNLINQYKQIGNNIYINLNNKNDILNKFNNFLNIINEIISFFYSLDSSFSSSITYKINKERNRVMEIKKRTINAKNRFKTICDKIENIEKEVSLKLSKINVEIIKEADINEFM